MKTWVEVSHEVQDIIKILEDFVRGGSISSRTLFILSRNLLNLGLTIQYSETTDESMGNRCTECGKY